MRRGQGMIEYALLIALVAVVIVGTLAILAGSVVGFFSGVAGAL